MICTTWEAYLSSSKAPPSRRGYGIDSPANSADEAAVQLELFPVESFIGCKNGFTRLWHYTCNTNLFGPVPPRWAYIVLVLFFLSLSCGQWCGVLYKQGLDSHQPLKWSSSCFVCFQALFPLEGPLSSHKVVNPISDKVLLYCSIK